jgi:tetratricopeptide (TPR) repeat protein
MTGELNTAENLFGKGELEECLNLINEELESDENNSDALVLRARVYYNQQKWGAALIDLNKVLVQNEKHVLAKNYKQMVLNILSFWNKDSYNP